MSLNPTLRRTLAAGAASAVALGGVVAMASTASAGVATNTYSCSNPAIGGGQPFPVTVATDVTLPPTAPAGFDVPANLLEMKNKVTIPAQVAQTLGQFQVKSLDLNDYKLTLADGKVGAGSLVTTPAAFTADAGGQTYSAQVDGKNAAFTTPKAGTYAVTAPTAFKVVATLSNDATTDLACTLGTAPTSVGSVTIEVNPATITAKAAKKKFPKGKVAKVKVTVKAGSMAPTGQVKAQIGKKMVGKGTLNDAGKTVIKIKPKFLKPGKNKVKLSYAGDDYSSASKAKVVVKVAG